MTDGLTDRDIGRVPIRFNLNPDFRNLEREKRVIIDLKKINIYFEASPYQTSSLTSWPTFAYDSAVRTG